MSKELEALDAIVKVVLAYRPPKKPPLKRKEPEQPERKTTVKRKP